MGLAITPFAVEYAGASTLLNDETVESGLSLVDRTCLASSSEPAVPSLTANRVWSELKVEVVSVRLIR